MSSPFASSRAPRRFSLLAPLLLASACSGEEPAPAPRTQGQAQPVPPFTVLARWEQPGSIRVAVDRTRSPVTGEQLERAVARALQAWSCAGRVGFLRVELPADPAAVDLLVRWTDGSDPAAAGFGRDTSVAATLNAGRRADPGPCEVLLDAARPWDPGGADLEAALVHELGHALGLGHVEVEGSALHPQRELAAARPGPADLAGLYSLYGGGSPAPGDLAVSSGGERGPVLRQVAPPARSAWTVFDADGDGDDELLVWATGAGDGALTAYHFEPGPRGPLLARTGGPYLGTAGHGATVVPWVAQDGARHLDVAWPDGSSVRRRLDERGAPLPPRAGEEGARALDAAPQARDRGDLDGDGVDERVEPLD